MRINKLIIVIITASIVYLPCTAQKNLYSGYIIKNEGDTVYGNFKKSSDFRRQKFCVFSESSTGIFRAYTPNEITNYFIEQPNIFYKATTLTKPNGQEKPIFAEGLELGTVNLYLTRSVYSGDNLLLTKGQLEYDLSVDNEDMPQSRAILKTLLTNCREIDAGIFNLINSVPSFVKLINQYNNCIDSSGTNYSNKYQPTINVDLSLFLGYSVSRVPVQILKQYPQTDSIGAPMGYTNSSYKAYEAVLNPVWDAGAEFDLSCPALIKNLSFVFGLNYQYSQTNQDLRNYRLNRDSLALDTLSGYKKINMHYLSIPLLLKYEFLSKHKISPYINAGVVFSIPLTGSFLMNQTDLEIPTEGFYNTAYFIAVSSSQLNGGIGVNYNLDSGKSLFLEFRFDKIFHADVYDDSHESTDYSKNYSYNFHVGFRL